ncbi:MAG: Gfo/Idh/MocA family oxidoreductase [Chloroflexia bacterium]
MTNIAIIGAGNMGRYHGHILNNFPDANVVVVADPEADRATMLAEALSAESETSRCARWSGPTCKLST